MLKKKFSAVILAAGNSSRMGTEKSKLLIEIGGISVLERTLKAFSSCEIISEIVIVCRGIDRDRISKIAERTEKEIKIVNGGDTRQQSVKNGISAISDSNFFVIHDGARPLVKQKLIETVCKNAESYGVSAAAVKVKDTIKIANKEGFVEETPPRGLLWAMQTPQVLKKEIYFAAIEKAEEKGLDFTDDCQLAEFFGAKVYLTEADYTNIKITTPEDVVIAEALCNREQECEE